MPLSDEEIQRIFLTYFSKQYGEEAAKQLLEQLPEFNYSKAIAREAEKKERERIKKLYEDNHAFWQELKEEKDG